MKEKLLEEYNNYPDYISKNDLEKLFEVVDKLSKLEHEDVYVELTPCKSAIFDVKNGDYEFSFEYFLNPSEGESKSTFLSIHENGVYIANGLYSIDEAIEIVKPNIRNK